MRSNLTRRSFLAALVAMPAAAAAFPAPLIARDAALGISIRIIQQFDPAYKGLMLHPDAFSIVMRPLEIDTFEWPSADRALKVAREGQRAGEIAARG